MDTCPTPKKINGLCIYAFPCSNRVPTQRLVLHSFSSIGNHNMTIENCQNICKDFDYFGVQNGDDCFCGDDTSDFIPAPLYQCNKPCSGDPSQFCGGTWRLNVFKNDQKNTPILKTTTTAKTTTIAKTTTTAEPTPKPSPNSVLLLSVNRGLNRPIVTTFDGVVTYARRTYERDLPPANYGCAVTLKDEFWYLGGNNYEGFQRYVRKIDDCELIRQSFDLPFNFNGGSCNTFSLPEEKVFMCFNYDGNGLTDNRNSCYLFDGEMFDYAASSACNHELTYGLANYRGKALTTGAYFTDICNETGTNTNVITEIYDFTTDQWDFAPDYPFANSISYYSVASTKEAAFIIGGFNSGDFTYYDMIAQFKDNAWSLYGNLQRPRYGHGSITLGDQTMIIGGVTSDNTPLSDIKNVETEIWDFANNKTISTMIDPFLPNGEFMYGLGLYLVPDDYCDKQ